MQFLHVVTGGDTHRVVSIHLVNVRGASVRQPNDRDACGAPEGHSMQFLHTATGNGTHAPRRRRRTANARRCVTRCAFPGLASDEGSASTTNAPASGWPAHHRIIRRRKARSTAREARLGDRPPKLAPLRGRDMHIRRYARRKPGCRAQAPLGRRTNLASELRGGALDRLDDRLIARAAAEVACQRLADRLLEGPVRASSADAEEHARRTEPALDAAALDERALDGPPRRRRPPAPRPW